MGNVKISRRDGRIVFHVGKELPNAGESFLLVPGKQSAQGRGIYAEDAPNLQYVGGEHYQKKLERVPIFCLPMQGEWARATMKKKDKKVVYHSAGGLLLMEDLSYVDGEYQGVPVRWYASTKMSRFQEPPGQDRSDSMLDRLRSGSVSQDQVLEWLNSLHSQKWEMNSDMIFQKLAEMDSAGPISHELIRRLRLENKTEDSLDFKEIRRSPFSSMTGEMR